MQKDRQSRLEDEVIEKDPTETELEKLLFGDDEGFYDGIRYHEDAASRLALRVHNQNQDLDSADDERALEHVDDADVKANS